MITEDMLKRAYLDDAMWHYFQRKLSAVPEAERLLRVEETLKFLFILSECDGPIPVAPEIDEVWHLWILQTREYMALCEQLPTGSYLHHCSYDYVRHSEPAAGQEKPVRDSIKALATYVNHFGPFSAERARYWPYVGRLMQVMSWSLDDLNHWISAPESESPRPTTAPPRAPRPAELLASV